jgi:CRISPR-associated protein Csd2
MGRKATLPYGLYRAHGFVSPKFARDAGFSESDLALLWEALENLFEHDRSAARGFMNTRKLIIFKHASELGNAPAHRLFDCVTVTRLVGDRPPRSFADYHVEVGRERVPAGVEVMERP